MFLKAFVVLASITTALAVPFITQPTASTTFSGGRPASVRWQDSGSAPNLTQYGPCSIHIYVGNALQQTRLQTLNASVDVSKASEITFTPDASIGPNSSEYFIRIESLSLKEGQYPAMAFSSKFTLDSMTGVFSTDIQNQIKGQSTAPLASPTGTGSGTPVSRSASTTSFSSSKSATGTSSSSAVNKSGSAAITTKAGWSGILLTALFGAAML